jgi:16S rRNA processing protein RimM
VASPDWNDLVVVGEIARAHGIAGEVSARAASGGGEGGFAGLDRVFVGSGPDDLRELRLAASRPANEDVLLRFEGIATRDDAAALAGLLILIPRADAPPLPDSGAYFFQLPGLRVEAPDGTLLGEIVDVIENPGNDVWVAKGPRGEFLIPAIDSIVRAIDVAAGRVVIDPIPGLLPDAPAENS